MSSSNFRILSAVIASVLVLGTVSYVAAEEQKPELKDVLNDISKDLEKYVKDDSVNKIDETEKFEEIKSEHSEILDETLDTMLDGVGINYDQASEEHKDILKQLMIQEELKWEKIKYYDQKANADDKLNKQSIIDWILPPASASYCPPAQNISYFKQVSLDINGQSGFEGNNGLYDVQRSTLNNCVVKYTLTFHDEDHPVDWIDESYDQYRLERWERIQDVEVFYVQPDGINFDGTWSNGQDFDTWTPWHYTTTKSFSNTVYVSNTWNHLMDTVDENSGMSKHTWLF